MFGFTKSELRTFRSLNTPPKIQDFLETIPINFEKNGDTCFSPRMVLKEKRCHCIEGALLAAAGLRMNGYAPLIVDLEANSHDDDHVIAVFKQHGCWGAISKTNHAILRYRDPVYRSIRELVMSYFPEYTNDEGTLNLRSFSRPVNLSRFDRKGWMTAEEDVWYIPEYLVKCRHYRILTPVMARRLRKADPLVILSRKMEQWRSQR